MGVWNTRLEPDSAPNIPTKTAFIIGGSEETQNAFIKLLYPQRDSFLDAEEMNVISNTFFLGYTFIRYKDESKEVLSTLQIYTLPDRYTKHLEMAMEIVTRNVKRRDLIFIPLLDYSENPNSWMRDLHTIYNKAQSSKDEQEDQISEILIAVTNKQSKIDWDPEIHEYIQLCLRTLSLKHDSSLMYVKSNTKTPDLLKLVSKLAQFPIKINQKHSIEACFVDDLIIPKGLDTWGKISTLSDLINPEEECKKWDSKDENNKFIENYEKIVPKPRIQPSVMKTKTRVDVKKDTDTREALPLNQFLLTLYERRGKSNKIASVHGNMK